MGHIRPPVQKKLDFSGLARPSGNRRGAPAASLLYRDLAVSTLANTGRGIRDRDKETIREIHHE